MPPARTGPDLPEQWLRRRGDYSASRLELMTSSLLIVVGADVSAPVAELAADRREEAKARPKHGPCSGTLKGSSGYGDYASMTRRSPSTPARHGCSASAVIVAAKGGLLADVIAGDVLEVLDTERELRGQVDSAAATVRMLREPGSCGADVPTLREIRSLGQRTVEQLVDRHPIACRPIRDLLVDYLTERQPGVDYSTLVGLAYKLVGCFWADLERHHPGIDSLRPAREVAGAWKRRLRTKTTRSAPKTAAGRGRSRTARLPGHLGRRSGVLPGPGRVGVGRPQPGGRHGSRRARSPGRPRPAQGRTPPQGPHGQPHPRPAAGAARRWSEATNRWRRDAQALLAAAGSRPSPAAVHRRRRRP